MTTAADLLARTVCVYRSCRTYRAVGEAHSVLVRGERPWQRSTSRFPFQTAFASPDRFVFEFKTMTVGPSSEWPHFAVCRRGALVRSFDTLQTPPQDAYGSVQQALAAAVGACSAIASAVPWTLLGSDTGFESLPRAEEVELAGPDDVDGRVAWRLHASAFSSAAAWWIDSATGLLLRHFERHRFKPEAVRAQREQLLASTELSETEKHTVASTPDLPHEFAVERTTFLRPEVDVDLPDGAFDIALPA